MTESNKHITLTESNQSPPLKNLVTIKSQMTPQTVSSGNARPIQFKGEEAYIDNIAKIVQKPSSEDEGQGINNLFQDRTKEKRSIQEGTLSNLTAIISTVDTAVNSCFDRETPTPSVIQECRHNIIKMLDESVSGRNYPMKSHIKDNSDKNVFHSASNSNSNATNANFNTNSNNPQTNLNPNENMTTTFSYYLQKNTLLNEKNKERDKGAHCKLTQLYQQIQEQEEENEQQQQQQLQQNNHNFNYGENENNILNNESEKENYFNKQFDYQMNKNLNSNSSNNNSKQSKKSAINNNNNNNMIFNMNVNMNLVPPNYIDYDKNNNNMNHINSMRMQHAFSNQHMADFNSFPPYQGNQMIKGGLAGNQFNNKNNNLYHSRSNNDEMMNMQHKMAQMYLGQENEYANNPWSQPNESTTYPSMPNYYPMKMQMMNNNMNTISMKHNSNNYQDLYMNPYSNPSSNDYLNQQLFQNNNPFTFSNNFPLSHNNQSIQTHLQLQKQQQNIKKKPKIPNQNLSNLNINELVKNSNHLCKDQSGCRLIQKKIDEDPSIAQQIIQNAFDNLIEIITDPFGNYLIQKLFDFMLHEQFCQLMALIQIEIYQICCNSFGTRVIQKLLDYLTSETLIQTFTLLIKSTVKDIMVDINGGHILLKAIDFQNPISQKILLGEICLNIVSIASHKHGCCVLQKVIEKVQPKAKQQIISYLLVNWRKLILDQCGNYIIQYIITLQDEAIHVKIVDNLTSDILTFSKHKYSSNVVEKCFECCNPVICNKLLFAMKSNRICIELLFDKFGNYVLQKALVRADEKTQQFIFHSIAPYLDKVKNYPFGIKLYCKLINTYSYLSSVLLHKLKFSQCDNSGELGEDEEQGEGEGDEIEVEVEEDNSDEVKEKNDNNGNMIG